MGRRKKEPESVHRENIAQAAEHLFFEKGVDNTTMDDVAREAGYSKATLYVYFANKGELIHFLVLKSMKLLKESLAKAVTGQGTIRDKYDRICEALVFYQEQYPFYFSLVLGKIDVEFKGRTPLPVETETVETGEQINRILASFIQEGIASGEFRPGLPVLETVFLFWSSLSGLIRMADSKQAYIEQAMGITKQQFLTFGFEQLYRMAGGEES